MLTLPPAKFAVYTLSSPAGVIDISMNCGGRGANASTDKRPSRLVRHAVRRRMVPRAQFQNTSARNRSDHVDRVSPRLSANDELARRAWGTVTRAAAEG